MLHSIAHAVVRPCGCRLDCLKGLFMYFTVGSATPLCIFKNAPGNGPFPAIIRSLSDPYDVVCVCVCVLRAISY